MTWRRILALTCSTAVLLVPSQAALGWTGPTAAPPGNNVPAPLNVGTSPQSKQGGLGVNETTTPVFPFEVVGQSLLQGTVVLGGSNLYLNFGTGSSGSAGYGLRDNAGIMEYKNSGGSWTSISAAGVWTTSGTNIYNANTGNVGIGTNAPAFPLDTVNKTGTGTTGSPTMRLTSLNGWSSLYFNSYAEGVGGQQPVGAIFGQAAAGWNSTMHFMLNNNWGVPTVEVMTLKSSGGAANVGIGTTAPGYKLDVSGVIRGSNELISSSITGVANIRMIGGNYGAFFRNDGSDTYLMFTASGSQYGSWNSLRPFHVSDATGLVTMENGLSVSGGLSSDKVTSPQYCIGTSCITSWPSGGGTVSGTANYVAKFTGASTVGNSLIFDNGTNVGIGTASPGAKLTVSGGAILLDNNQPLEALDTGGTVRNLLSLLSTNDTKLNAFAGQGISFQIGNSEKMRLDLNGNVGIGTASPVQNLDVSGTARATNFELGSGSGGYFGFNQYWNGSNWIYRNSDFGYIIRNGGSRLQIFAAPSGTAGATTANTEVVSILASGNVGIGTVSPGQKLDVNGIIRGNNELISSSIAGAANIRMIGSNYGAFFRNDGSATYLLFTASGDQYGTWNALRPFYVNDSTGFVTMSNGVSVSGGLSSDNVTSPQYCIGTSCITSWPSSGTVSGTANYVAKFTGASTVGNSLIFDNGTNVGIGTAGPSQKLDVNGNVNAAGYCVNGTCGVSGTYTMPPPPPGYTQNPPSCSTGTYPSVGADIVTIQGGIITAITPTMFYGTCTGTSG